MHLTMYEHNYKKMKICLCVKSQLMFSCQRLLRSLTDYWGISSAGRAPALHAGGHRFDPVILHHFGVKHLINLLTYF